MDTDNFFNEYLADVGFAALPHIMHNDHDDSQFFGLGGHDEQQHQIGHFASGKELFGDNDCMDGTVSPSWLSHLQFEPTSNPESSGDPSPVFSGSIDEDMGQLQADTKHFEDEPEALTHLLLDPEQEKKPESVFLGANSDELQALEISIDDVHLKREEVEDMAMSPITSSAATLSVRKRRKRSTAGNNDKVRRQKFLERNRVAASKCRRKKKEAEQALEGLQKQMEDDHMALKSLRATLVSEFAELQSMLMAHSGCGSASVDQWLATRSTRLEGILGKEALDAEFQKPLEDQPGDGADETPTMQHLPPAESQAAHHTSHNAAYQTPRTLLQHSPLATEQFQPSADPVFSANYDHSPRLCAGDFTLLPSANKNMRNASLASSFASMTSYASSNFAASDFDAQRKSSTDSTGSSYKLSPISSAYADFSDSMVVDLTKPEAQMELLAETSFESICSS
ncbi:bzip transcription factor [Grosmannia clavigera kw1407]|uniref:Bzip transcription factor n=1 Tax=Grosmannia clavigera (strain kw1407 / UAMH 11150) TaxID=655863 RepID=F0XE98_GROCL|nr:bzip transcription factor [Grosmannia clavigera kw1407]EFX04316.1 bzip transcription factor [Grosmannia clavigera kw1407]